VENIMTYRKSHCFTSNGLCGPRHHTDWEVQWTIL